MLKHASRGLKLTGVLAAAVLLSGCALLSTPTPPNTYTLTAPDFAQKGSRTRGLMVVAQPTAIQALDSQSIVARPSTGEITYIENAQWSDNLTRLLQARIIESFENANNLTAVGKAGDRLSADYQLVTDIRTFEVDAQRGAAIVELSVKLVNERSGRIVSGAVFHETAPISEVSGLEASRALDAALAKVLRKIVVWAERT